LLADVAALVEAHQRPRHLLDAFQHVFLPGHPALGQPAGHHPLGLGEMCLEVVDEESLHPRALVADSPPVTQAVALLAGLQVLGDPPAEHHAAVAGQVRQRRVQDGAAHVVEEQVDAAGAQLAEAALDVFRAVVDRRFVAELLHQQAALLFGASDADGAATEVAHDEAAVRAHAAGRTGDHHRVTGLQPADLRQPQVAREAGDPQHAQRGGERHLALLDLVHHVVGRAVAD